MHTQAHMYTRKHMGSHVHKSTQTDAYMHAHTAYMGTLMHISTDVCTHVHKPRHMHADT